MEPTESPMLGGTSEELFALANAVAAVVGGPVSVEDLDRRVLAYSSLPDQRMDELRRRGILERQVPDTAERPEQQSQYREVLAAAGVVRLPPLAEDELPRAAAAIRAGDLPLGTLWAIEGPAGLDQSGERALLDGARLAALHMLRRRSAAELDLHAREEALRGALSGHWSAAEVRFRLGLSERTHPVTLVGLAPLRLPDREPPELTRLAAVAARHWSAVHAEAAVTALGSTVYALLPELDPTAVRRLAEQAVSTVGRSLVRTPGEGGTTPLRAAISRPAEELSELTELRAEVDDILRVTAYDQQAPETADLTEVHARVLLAHFADELARRPRLRHPGVTAMVEHDRTQHTAYAASTAAWLDAVGNIAQAAERLSVHPNTLKYRLRRARELFGLDLDHPDDRLSCWLQLRLQQRQ
ncbi:PucR family transcriptional regulator [Saccharothrix sp. ST-888]|uniref:PucR family transcriptional regulator n=1 Tax=Saccharothrix sp. ST-888 TaxID=1427391 RepID=UPI0012E0BC69|nr:helix-turn-helix domain-containing protein [Saccharothrix sp. ST-888]